MIIDRLENADKYFSVHPLFSKAFAYIKSQNLKAIEPGNNKNYSFAGLYQKTVGHGGHTGREYARRAESVLGT